MMQKREFSPGPLLRYDAHIYKFIYYKTLKKSKLNNYINYAHN